MAGPEAQGGDLRTKGKKVVQIMQFYRLRFMDLASCPTPCALCPEPSDLHD